MAQQVYNVQKEGTDQLAATVNPVTYTSDPAAALEYDTSTDGMTAATYFTAQTSVNHVVVGPHPKPHR